MHENQFTVEAIKDLMETMNRCRLGKLQLEQGDFKLRLEGCRVEQVIAEGPVRGLGPEYDASAVRAEPAAFEADNANLVTSPIVGTFYAAPAPDKEPFVQVGSQVRKGDVLFIIESMKLMNEVTSELDGVVSEILVENAQGVEYGQPILKIK